MKKVMIIGSVHTDLVQYVRELPRGNENAEVLKSETRIAGGGYAAGSIFHELGFPFQVICDPGDGVYGEYARNEALQNEIELLEGSEETGGCTYTLIDQNGAQGVFLVDGSEYHFSLAQVYDISPDEFGAVLVYSEMLVSEGSEEIIDLLNEMEVPVYVCFSSRTAEISSEMIDALCAFEPVMIMRDEEAYELCGRKAKSADEAAAILNDMSKAPVIILMKKNDVLYLDAQTSWIAPAKQKLHTDTWASAFAAAQMAGVDTKNGMMFANENGASYDAETMKQRLAGMILHR